MIRKVVIPTAGLGTRLLPATKEQPKEMLSIFSRGLNGQICLKPLLQLVFEQLYDAGFREFCFIVGRGKRAIEDHFTPDYTYVDTLRRREKNDLADELEGFYQKVRGSSIVWVNQPTPRGFGDAVLQSKLFAGVEPILVHAGDTYIMSNQNQHVKRLVEISEKFDVDAVFMVQEIEDPRQYGVVEVEEVEHDVYRVKNAVEKPEKPPTNLAIMPIYVFRPVIFKAIEVTRPGKGEEIQLTDAIQKLIDWGLKVCAIKLDSNDIRLDIGTTETYWEALRLSYNYAQL